MAVAKMLKPYETFYKYILSSSEVYTKNGKTYLTPNFYFAYRKILYFYLQEEPEHPLLRETDRPALYSHLVKEDFYRKPADEKTAFLRASNCQLEDIYEEVEVEQTLLLQYLIENYEYSYSFEHYMLTSRRKREYQIAAVPDGLLPIFKRLNFDISTRENQKAGKNNYGLNQASLLKETNFSGAFLVHSVSSATEMFSFSAMVEQQMHRSPLLFVDSERVDGKFPLTPHYFKDRNNPSKSLGLTTLLAGFEVEKKKFLLRYQNLSIKEEVLEYLAARLTNQDKLILNDFLSEKRHIMNRMYLSNFFYDVMRTAILNDINVTVGAVSQFYAVQNILGQESSLYSNTRVEEIFRNLSSYAISWKRHESKKTQPYMPRLRQKENVPEWVLEIPVGAQIPLF